MKTTMNFEMTTNEIEALVYTNTSFTESMMSIFDELGINNNANRWKSYMNYFKTLIGMDVKKNFIKVNEHFTTDIAVTLNKQGLKIQVVLDIDPAAVSTVIELYGDIFTILSKNAVKGIIAFKEMNSTLNELVNKRMSTLKNNKINR